MSDTVPSGCSHVRLSIMRLTVSLSSTYNDECHTVPNSCPDLWITKSRDVFHWELDEYCKIRVRGGWGSYTAVHYRVCENFMNFTYILLPQPAILLLPRSFCLIWPLSDTFQSLKVSSADKCQLWCLLPPEAVFLQWSCTRSDNSISKGWGQHITLLPAAVNAGRYLHSQT